MPRLAGRRDGAILLADIGAELGTSAQVAHQYGMKPRMTQCAPASGDARVFSVAGKGEVACHQRKASRSATDSEMAVWAWEPGSSTAWRSLGPWPTATARTGTVRTIVCASVVSLN